MFFKKHLTVYSLSPHFLFYRKHSVFDSFIIPDTKNFSSRFFTKEKRCRNLLTPLHSLILTLRFMQTVCTNSNLHYSLSCISSSACAIICLYCSFTLSGASICTLPLKPNTQPKKVGLADTSVYTLKDVISYARVVTSSPKRSTIVFIRLLSHRKSTRTFSPENIKKTSFV